MKDLRDGGAFYAVGVDAEMKRAEDPEQVGSYERAQLFGLLAIWCELRRIADALESGPVADEGSA